VKVDLAHTRNAAMYRYLMVLTIASAVGLQGWRTLFDNFSVRVVGLDGSHIGIIQSVREIPGFLALLVVFVMLLLREHRISSLSIATMGIGVGLVGFFPSFAGVIVTTLIVSFGFHYFETTNQSLTLQYFDLKTAPLVFGRQRSYAAAANVAVGIFIFFVAPVLSYTQIYVIVGALLVAVGIWSLTKNPSDSSVVLQRKRMILRRRYWLYYFLTFLAGARRQIFVAFAVFLLVKKFDFSLQEIAVLFLVNNVINYFLSPLIGKSIVRFGERKVLSLEYFSLILVFVGYALADSKLLVAFLYIADHIFFNFAMAIRTFFQKIADPRDIAPSMAAGFTINHIAAVILPVIGGLLWMVDYRIPFLGGAALSLVSLIAVQQITRQLRMARGRPQD
jgi:hypothetical protein